MIPPELPAKQESLCGIELDRLIFTKLMSGWTKEHVNEHLILARKKMSWRSFYSCLTELCSETDVRNFSAANISGAYVGGGDLTRIFNNMLAVTTALGRWEIPASADCLQILIFQDGRRIWGKNELLALGLKQVKKMQSPDNIFPIATAHWPTSSETFERLQMLVDATGLDKFIAANEGRLVSVGGRVLPLRFMLAVDWMSLIPSLNNTDQPSARPTANYNPCNCGLCNFRGTDKMEGWRSNPLYVWHRVTAESQFWNSAKHLYPLGPDSYIWEPLHCHMRVLDTIVHWILDHSSSGVKKQIEQQLARLGRHWRSAQPHTLILKEVCWRNNLLS